MEVDRWEIVLLTVTEKICVSVTTLGCEVVVSNKVLEAVELSDEEVCSTDDEVSYEVVDADDDDDDDDDDDEEDDDDELVGGI